MESQHTVIHNDIGIPVRKYGSDFVVNVIDMAKALNLNGKTGRDLLRNGIPKDSIITVPITKRNNLYYLKKEGIIAFLKKYRPEELDNFIAQFDTLVEEETKDKEESEQELKNKINNLDDPLIVDLLEDILHKINENGKESKKFYDAAVSMYSRQMVLLIEMEALYSKVAAILLKAESLGPIARLNKELTRDIIALGKDCFSDAMACEQMLKEYDNLEGDGETTESNKANNSDDLKTSGLLIRTDKKDKNSGKKH